MRLHTMAITIERMGRWVDADEAFKAWTSGDLARMLAARSVNTNPIDLHFLLQGIVNETYRLRSDPRMRELCIETGGLHTSANSHPLVRRYVSTSTAASRVFHRLYGFPQPWPRTDEWMREFESAKLRLNSVLTMGPRGANSPGHRESTKWVGASSAASNTRLNKGP